MEKKIFSAQEVGNYVKIAGMLFLLIVLQSCAIVDNTGIAIDKKFFERQEKNAGNYKNPPDGFMPITVYVKSANSQDVDKAMADLAVNSLESYASRSRRFKVIDSKIKSKDTDALLIVRIDKLTERGENVKSTNVSGKHNTSSGEIKSSLSEEKQIYGTVSITFLQNDEKVIFQGTAKLSSYKAANLFSVLHAGNDSNLNNKEQSFERIDDVDHRRVLKVAVDRATRKLVEFVDSDFIADNLYSANN